MRILYFSFVELDVPNACSTHTLGIIKGFARHGCRVDALVPRPIQTVPRIPQVRFFYLWPWQFSRLGGLWIRFLSGILMFWLCLTHRYDFIYVRELQINPGPRWCSRLFKIPLYIEINDLLIPYFSSTGAKPEWVEAISRNQQADFRQAEGMIVNSIPMRQWFLDQYRLELGKFHLVFNGAEFPEEPVWGQEEARAGLGIPLNSFCLGFLGNFYWRYDFDTLLEACCSCRRQVPELFLLFVGDGPSKENLARRLSEEGFHQNVLFTGYVESKFLGRYLPAMDVGLCLGDRYFTRMYGGFSTKIATYGLYRIPAIVTGIPHEEHPEALRTGLFFIEPENPAALADLIMRLYRNRREITEKAAAFHSFVKMEMTWDATAGKILNTASRGISGRRRAPARPAVRWDRRTRS
jgi:glycosyltransferase involved in cell wall biosynthesis